MNELNFIPKTKEKDRTECLLEIDGFIYCYSRDSKVYYNGRKYLCFKSTSCNMWEMDMTDDEKCRSYEEFNVYMMPLSAGGKYVYIRNSALKERIIEQYKKQCSSGEF
jgi:hypothetical protein